MFSPYFPNLIRQYFFIRFEVFFLIQLFKIICLSASASTSRYSNFSVKARFSSCRIEILCFCYSDISFSSKSTSSVFTFRFENSPSFCWRILFNIIHNLRILSSIFVIRWYKIHNFSQKFSFALVRHISHNCQLSVPSL